MPYRWTEEHTPRGPARRLQLWPHRSLPRRGFAAFILATFALITIPLYPLLGTILLWGILPFGLVALAGLWWALQRSYRDGTLSEELCLDDERIHLRRIDPTGRVQEWDCQSYWARVNLHESGGPVPFYVTLSGKGREVEIGAFLSEDERKTLHEELREALAQRRGAGGSTPGGGEGR